MLCDHNALSVNIIKRCLKCISMFNRFLTFFLPNSALFFKSPKITYHVGEKVFVFICYFATFFPFICALL